EPALNTEVSTIDTAIFYTGCRHAAAIIKNKDLTDKIEDLISKIDVQWMIDNSPSKKLICHGIHKSNFINCEWDDYNVGVILYKLFGLPYKPIRYHYDL